jgi:putative transposase
VKILKAYKFRLKTNPEIEEKLLRTSGCVRFVWNKALSLNKERLDHRVPLIKFNDLAGFLKLWKQSEEYEFLKEAPSQPLQQKLKDLGRAIGDSFKLHKGFSRFKKKNIYNSFRYSQGFKMQGNRIYLPKIGWVRFFKSRDIRGTPKNTSLTCPVCGNVSKENRESQAVFVCKSCGFSHNADWISAENARQRT